MKTFVKDGQQRPAFTPAQEVNLRADGWRELQPDPAPEPSTPDTPAETGELPAETPETTETTPAAPAASAE